MTPTDPTPDSPDSPGSPEADARHRAWLREQLDTALAGFHVRAVGPARFGWHDKTISTKATDGSADRWVRVACESPWWADQPFWRGNADAQMITDVPKPRIIRSSEYDQPRDGEPMRVRADLMTYLPGTPCSPTAELHDPPRVTTGWWTALRDALDQLAATPTDRTCLDQDRLTRRLLAFYGDRIDPDVQRWETAHGDLHWSNLMRPELAILDWETWGTAPAGYDAATLYCHTLLVPAYAAEVHDRFADHLDTPDGIRCQLYVASRLLLHIDQGDNPDLAIPLHRHIDTLLHTAG